MVGLCHAYRLRDAIYQKQVKAVTISQAYGFLPVKRIDECRSNISWSADSKNSFSLGNELFTRELKMHLASCQVLQRNCRSLAKMA